MSVDLDFIIENQLFIDNSKWEEILNESSNFDLLKLRKILDFNNHLDKTSFDELFEKYFDKDEDHYTIPYSWDIENRDDKLFYSN